MAMITMWFASLAKVNVGVITVIWSVNPLFMAITDFFLFKVQMRYYHYVGMAGIVICTILISLKPFFIEHEIDLVEEVRKAASEAPKLV